jgi:phospholipase C
MPPFVPPNPDQPDSGKASVGLDPSVEYVRMAQEDERQKQHPGSARRTGPIGLGFRVPLVIASPWSRGGYVNSQVCDHTSIIRMVETLVSHRTGKPIREANISNWRRTVCGDLSSTFRPSHNEKPTPPEPLQRDSHLKGIHQAQFRKLPDGFRALSAEDIAQFRRDPQSVPWLPRQEAGIRPSCALPYELAVDARLTADRSGIEVRFAAGHQQFGKRSAGAAFQV